MYICVLKINPCICFHINCVFSFLYNVCMYTFLAGRSRSCSELRRQSAIRQDGDYDIFVRGRPRKVSTSMLLIVSDVEIVFVCPLLRVCESGRKGGRGRERGR